MSIDRHFMAAVFSCVLTIILAISAAAAPSASAFNDYQVFGVTMQPGGFASGSLAYDLILNAGAYLVYNNQNYAITEIWGFYALNNSGISANNFAATGSNLGKWKWSVKGSSSSRTVAGWANSSKSEAMKTPLMGSVSKTFTFKSFSFSGETPKLGLHVTLDVPCDLESPFGGGNTGYVTFTPPNYGDFNEPVPEPSSLFLPASGLVVGILTINRKKR